MKKHIVVFFLFLLFENLKSQTSQYFPFPTDTAQWSVSHNFPSSTQTLQYKMKGDSILYGVTYHKIYLSPDVLYNSTNETFQCLFREDLSKKVYVKYPPGLGRDTSEFLLYDFNLSIGDTATIKLNNFTTDSLFKMEVLYSDSSLLGGSYRKMIMLRAISGTVIWGCDDMWWIEGIGASENGLLYNEFPECSCFCDNTGYQLNCFWDNGTYLWGGTLCDYTTNNNELINKDLIVEIFPNPSNGNFNLNYNSEYKNFVDIEIINIEGVIVYDEMKIPIHRFNTFEIDLRNGLYFLKVTNSDNHKMLIQKLVIQN